MASEREQALSQATLISTEADPKLVAAFSDAEHKRQELANAHAYSMRRAELGWFGLILGSASNAPLVIAFIAVVLGFITASALWVFAYRSGRSEFWSSEAHFALGAATTAIGYVFGRSNKSKSDE